VPAKVLGEDIVHADMSVLRDQCPGPHLPADFQCEGDIRETTALGLSFRLYLPHSRDVNPSTAVALLLHGMFGCSRDMHSIAVTLSGHPSEPRLVLVPDLPYHGRSRQASPENPSDAAKLLVRAMQAVLSHSDTDILRIVVIGYSLGGRLALEIGALRDRCSSIRLEALVLMSSGMPPQGEDERTDARRRNAALAARMRSFESVDDFRSWLQNSWYASSMWGQLTDSESFPVLIQSRIDGLGEANSESSRLRQSFECLALAAERFCPSEMTTTIHPEMLKHVRVLHVHGVYDAKYALVANKMRASFIPQVQVASVLEAGHNVVFERPEVVSRTAFMYLSSLSYNGARAFSLRDVYVHPYRLQLRTPMKVGEAVLNERRGFLIGLRGSNSEIGVGDISPLPGLHSESLADCLEQMQAWARQALSRDDGGLRAKISVTCLDATLVGVSPSVAAGISAAATQCLACANFVDVVELLRVRHGIWAETRLLVRVNGVVPRQALKRSGPDVSNATAILRKLPNNTVLKLKVGCEGLASDVAAVHLLAQALRGKNCLLRPDANRSWSKEDFLSFCSQTDALKDAVEYIEEPFAVNHVLEFIDFCNVTYKGSSGPYARIGLDESLVQFDINESSRLIASRGVIGAVLKPSVQGTLTRLECLAHAAQREDKMVVLSAVFESGVGLAWTAVLACVLGYPSNAHHGIGTFTALQGDCISPGFEELCVTSDGTINVQCVMKEYLVNAARLVFEKGADVRESSFQRTQVALT
jgi:o-succinylbenzoate synthase